MLATGRGAGGGRNLGEQRLWEYKYAEHGLRGSLIGCVVVLVRATIKDDRRDFLNSQNKRVLYVLATTADFFLPD